MIVVRTNLPDFKAQLDAIANDLKKKAVRAALSKGAQVFAKQARANAPVLQEARKGRVAGTLKRAIFASRTKKAVPPGTERYYVGVREGAKYMRVKTKRGTVNKDAFYWRFQEAGWIPRGPGQRIRGGKRTKALTRQRLRGSAIPGRTFLERAFAAKQQQAIDAFNAQMTTSLEQYNRLK